VPGDVEYRRFVPAEADLPAEFLRIRAAYRGAGLGTAALRWLVRHLAQRLGGGHGHAPGLGRRDGLIRPDRAPRRAISLPASQPRSSTTAASAANPHWAAVS
jgi:GNAT superfamily N-acetyltransferase